MQIVGSRVTIVAYDIKLSKDGAVAVVYNKTSKMRSPSPSKNY